MRQLLFFSWVLSSSPPPSSLVFLGWVGGGIFLVWLLLMLVGFFFGFGFIFGILLEKVWRRLSLACPSWCPLLPRGVESRIGSINKASPNFCFFVFPRTDQVKDARGDLISPLWRLLPHLYCLVEPEPESAWLLWLPFEILMAVLRWKMMMEKMITETENISKDVWTDTRPAASSTCD